MTVGVKPLLAAIGVAIVGGAIVGGYLLGREEAPTEDDAVRAARTARHVAYADAFRRSQALARSKGLAAGIDAGKRDGERAGASLGRSRGDSDAQAQLAAQAAAAAAAQEAAERSANCGAPLFVEGYCPTDEEIARENAAEAYCGPGTAEGQAQAAELGIQC